MSLYGKYIKERLGREIIETEHAFITFYQYEDGYYVENVYVDPDYRKTGIASSLVDEVAEIAINAGYKKLYVSVVPSANGSNDSMRAILAYGFKLNSSANNFILLKKEL